MSTASAGGPRALLALAPPLIEPDDIGDGEEIGDGAVQSDQEHDARRTVADCPERAVVLRDRLMAPPAGRRLGHRLRPHRRRLGPTRSRSGTSCACPIAHTTRYGGLVPTPARRCGPIAYDTEHFDIAQHPGHRGPPADGAGPAGHRPADLVRSAVPQGRPPAAVAGVRSARPSQKIEQFTRNYCKSSSRRARTRRRRCRARTTRSTSRYT